MLTIYRILFGLSVLLLVVIHVKLETVKRKRYDVREVRMLRWLKFGMNLTAMSYLFHMIDYPRPGHISYSGAMFCLAGTVALLVGWSEFARIQSARTSVKRREATSAEIVREDAEPVAQNDGLSESGVPQLSTRARHVLVYAQEVARESGTAVDTEHILMGFLKEPCGVGMRILHGLEVDEESVIGVLATQTKGKTGPSGMLVANRVDIGSRRATLESLRQDMLSDRAREVIRLAGSEARRFDSAYVGTDHLLLGLVLKGDGRAAHALMQCGVTVDRIRQEIVKAKGVAG